MDVEERERGEVTANLDPPASMGLRAGNCRLPSVTKSSSRAGNNTGNEERHRERETTSRTAEDKGTSGNVHEEYSSYHNVLAHLNIVQMLGAHPPSSWNLG
jgi:hypothetical protein